MVEWRGRETSYRRGEGSLLSRSSFSFFSGESRGCGGNEIGCNGLSERHNAETVNPPTRKEKLSALFAPQPRNILMMFSFFPIAVFHAFPLPTFCSSHLSSPLRVIKIKNSPPSPPLFLHTPTAKGRGGSDIQFLPYKHIYRVGV